MKMYKSAWRGVRRGKTVYIMTRPLRSAAGESSQMRVHVGDGAPKRPSKTPISSLRSPAAEIGKQSTASTQHKSLHSGSGEPRHHYNSL